MKETKFYTCYQNNSGGYNIQDENVDKWVCVEARNVVEAQKKFEEIFENYREFCPCCGRRWDDCYLSKDGGYDTPCIYGDDYKEFYDNYWCNEHEKLSIIIYYANGKKEKYPVWKNKPHQHEDKGE